jgi:hypothetical protein
MLNNYLQWCFKIVLLQTLSGCSVARYRATFGMWRPQVRILPSRQKAIPTSIKTLYMSHIQGFLFYSNPFQYILFLALREQKGEQNQFFRFVHQKGSNRLMHNVLHHLNLDQKRRIQITFLPFR